MFNVIDFQTGIKVDLIFAKQRPFSRQEFQRREQTQIMGVECPVVTAEDSILSKLEWAKLTESERQLSDADGVCRVNSSSLDIAYLRKWASELQVEDLLQRVLSDTDGSDVASV